MASAAINAETVQYCFLDLDLDHHRAKLARAAAFVDATDSRYGFSSKDLRSLGGSELARIPELMASDHEWSSKGALVELRPPVAGNRILVKLHWDVAPLACENFATLCANGASAISGAKQKSKPAPTGESGKPLTYRNSVVHRILPGFVLQGGDFVFGNGSGGESIFGKKFKDERAGLAEKHNRRGILSMGNSGKNSNTSQWFITLAAAPQCDGKHVIFGQVVSGWEVLEAAEKLGSTSGEPTASVTITDCGLWTPFSPACGYWYDQPDAESFSGVSEKFIVRPRVAIVAPSDAVLDRFSKALLPYCSVMLILEEEAATVQELLDSFAVDVVVVAPACAKDVNLHLSESWGPRRLRLSEVILEAKPADALNAVHNSSWLSSWPLDGKS